AAQAAARRAAWNAQHNPVAMAEALVSPPKGVPRHQVVLLYPWSDLVEPRGGAARRCSSLLEFLLAHKINTFVLMGQGASGHRRGRMLGSLPRQTKAVSLLRSVLRGVLRTRYGLAGAEAEWLLWEYLRIRIDPRLRGHLRRVVASADTILLEYPFWA